MRLLGWFGPIAATAGLAVTSPLTSQQASGPELPPPTVVTIGVSEVRLPPDWAIISFSLQTRGPSAAQASTANRERLERLVDTLGRLMGPRDSVRVQALTIRPAETSQERQIVGYDAAAVIEVTLRNLDQFPSVFDAAFASGATIGPTGVRFRSDRADAAMDDALGQAFADARRQAQALAGAAGMRLGPIVEITTQPRLTAFRVADSRLAVAAAPVTPSDVIIQAFVQVTWRSQQERP